MNFSIDRFEGEYAVCENIDTEEIVNIKKDLLPKNCKEGTIISFINNTYIINEELTIQRHIEIKNLLDNLYKGKNNN